MTLPQAGMRYTGIAAALAVHQNTVLRVLSFDQDAVNNITLLIHLVLMLSDEIILSEHVLRELLILVIRQHHHRAEFTVLQIQLRLLPVKNRSDIQLDSLHFHIPCHLLNLRKLHQMLWIQNDLRFTPAVKQGINVLLADLRFVNPPLPTVPIGEPLGGFRFQCPG